MGSNRIAALIRTHGGQDRGVSQTNVFGAGCDGRLMAPSPQSFSFLFPSHNQRRAALGRAWEVRKQKRSSRERLSRFWYSSCLFLSMRALPCMRGSICRRRRGSAAACGGRRTRWAPWVTSCKALLVGLEWPNPCGRGSRAQRARGSLTAHGLGQREEVAFAVAEEGAAFARALARVVVPDLDHPVHDPEAGHLGRVDLLEDHPAGAQVGDHGFYVVDLEPDLRRLAGGRSRREEEVELPSGAAVAQAALSLLDRGWSEPVAVEGPVAVEV